ncbi:MAG TPA: hypothetical protein VFY87_24915, partial [Geminicoccaceae bacterium]|nr:hypothetical protein [Geminicoccaceae bacterium]
RARRRAAPAADESRPYAVAAWLVADCRAGPFAGGSYSVARPGMAPARPTLRQSFSERVRCAGGAATGTAGRRPSRAPT